MKKTILSFFVLATVGFTTLACKSDKKNETKKDASEQTSEESKISGTFTIDPGESTINWKGSKPMGEHIGTIDIKSGEIVFQDGKPTSGNVVIDMTSITVKDKDLDEEKKTLLENHLKGTAEGKEADFFNTTKFPTATFEITGSGENSGKTILEGNLTMKGKAHAVAFPVKISWSSDKSSVKLIGDTFTIDRTKWGVNYGSKSIFDNLGDNWVSDEIELDFAVKASKG